MKLGTLSTFASCVRLRHASAGHSTSNLGYGDVSSDSLCDPAVLAGQQTKSRPEIATEMRHIGKSPAIGNLAQSPMHLCWVFWRLSATLKAPRPNKTRDRRAVYGNTTSTNRLAATGCSSWRARPELDVPSRIMASAAGQFGCSPQSGSLACAFPTETMSARQLEQVAALLGEKKRDSVVAC